MKYTLNGLTLTLAAESVRDAALIADHFRELKLGKLHFDDPEALRANLARIRTTLDAVERGDLVYQAVAKQDRPWFPVNAELGPKAVKPYLDLLARVTGYTGELPEFEYVRSNAGLTHTHILAKCLVSSTGIKASGFIQSEDWNGRRAADRAGPSFEDYVVEGFGFRRHESEFTASANGQYQRNPHYLTRHAPMAGLGDPELWAQIFAWWRKTYATPGQEAVLQFAEGHRLSWQRDMDWDLRMGGGDQGSLVGSSGLTLAYSGKNAGQMAWETFAKLRAWTPEPEDAEAASAA